MQRWGNDYRYLFFGNDEDPRFGVYSCGADGGSGSQGNDIDDINTWNRSSPWRQYYREREQEQRNTRLIVWGFSSILVVSIILNLAQFCRARNRRTEQDAGRQDLTRRELKPS